MKTIENTIDFNAISLTLASPENIKEWSYGEVTKPETINYRTGRSERGGLFDERIFGPEKDYECYCGKYRRIRYKDIICEKCGVEVTRSIVRRDRMGHIELASPVAHIWFLRGVPSRLSILLNIPMNDLEKVIYFAGYVITKVNKDEKERILQTLETEYKNKTKNADVDTRERLHELMVISKKELAEIYEGKVLNEALHHHFVVKYSSAFETGIGAEAVYEILKNLDLKKLKTKTEHDLEKAGVTERERMQRRLGLLISFINADIRPEWMFLTVIPIIPPALRPMVALDGGRHATSDLNDLYRRVINRNNRLKKLKEIGAPDVILRNEKRILQEAVDSLIDNSMCQNNSTAVSQSQKRALKSLSDNLKSKQGLFRQNLLGKRVDYSGRSVIVVGPQLKLNQCGLPKHMALELFRPFVIARLIQAEMAHNIRSANRLIEERIPEVWAILEEIITNKYVLLNRAPTLHRLGIQAFQPVLIEGNAIRIHPLVCTAYNADFDGDQMAVYVPLSRAAQNEAHNLMSAPRNLLKPADGNPIMHPNMDIVLGIFWMTKLVKGERGEGQYFASPNHAITAYDFNTVSFRAKIKVIPTDKIKYKVFNKQIFETTVGRLLFNSVLPDDFEYINEEMNKKRLSEVVNKLILRYGIDGTPPILDKIKDFGFQYSTISGTTWGLDNLKVPPEKEAIVAAGRLEEAEILSQHAEGLLSEDEKYRKLIELWEQKRALIEKAIPNTLDPNGSTYDIVISGARGTIASLAQISGMKGLIVNPAGKTIDFPIIPSYVEGLSPLEYFITTHGARKGSADTALNTARAGYLTRKLVDVAQDVVVYEKDCGSKTGKIGRREDIFGIEISLARNLRGRVLAEDVKNSSSKVVYKRGYLVTKEDAEAIDLLGVEQVLVRSPLTCNLLKGVCQMCYGLDLGRNHLVDEGEAVGIVAAQAIGEPGTQLTLRTFHKGGVAGVDITAGLPRVEEIFDRRNPKNPAVVAKTDGRVIAIETRDLEGEKETVISLEIKSGSVEEYKLPIFRASIVKVGNSVRGGDILSEGSADLQEIFQYGGREATEDYIMREVMKVYELQGVSIAKKHIEIIIRQMFSRRRIIDSGDTSFSPADIVEAVEFEQENARVRAEQGQESQAEIIILGITETALNTKSWLSAASFQNTNRILIRNAVKGGVDELHGLKENVIIGRLIPAGTGFHKFSNETNG